MVVEINQKEGMTYYIHVQQLYDMARLSLERVLMRTKTYNDEVNVKNMRKRVRKNFN